MFSGFALILAQILLSTEFSNQLTNGTYFHLKHFPSSRKMMVFLDKGITWNRSRLL